MVWFAPWIIIGVSDLYPTDTICPSKDALKIPVAPKSVTNIPFSILAAPSFGTTIHSILFEVTKLSSLIDIISPLSAVNAKLKLPATFSISEFVTSTSFKYIE